MEESPRGKVSRVGFGLALVFVLGLAATFLSSSNTIHGDTAIRREDAERERRPGRGA